jgi:dolichol-phosphate mannosyltransferase
MKSPDPVLRPPLTLYSVIIPARDEEDSLEPMLRDLVATFRSHGIPHEVVVVDDGSTDGTWPLLQSLREDLPELAPVQNKGLNGFGRAIICGLDNANGDAAVIMMADASDDPMDAVAYWNKLNEGYDCAFGSRFIKGGAVYDYPRVKLFVNRLANLFLKLLFNIKLNDTTNAFKAYRMEVIEGCRPLIAPHFNLTVEIPLKAIVRGYSWDILPITWKNRTAGVPKLKIKEMGSRYLFICLYIWLEKFFSRGDYNRTIFQQQLERRKRTIDAANSKKDS